jgi:hypothetical protein
LGGGFVDNGPGLGLSFLLPYRLCVDFRNGWIELVQGGVDEWNELAFDVAGVAVVWVAAEDHAFDGLADVGLLINRNFFEAQVTPGVPVFTKYVAEAVVGGGVVGIAPGG